MTIKVLSLWNQPVLDAWLLVFHELLKRIPYEMIADSCEVSIDKLSEQSQHPQSKYAASRMIGFLAEVRYFFREKTNYCLYREGLSQQNRCLIRQDFFAMMLKWKFEEFWLKKFW